LDRKFDRQYQINKKAIEIMEDPATIHYLSTKIIRRKPGLMPRFVWKAFLYVVLAPSTREKSVHSPDAASGTP
jgi:hypothetical protein